MAKETSFSLRSLLDKENWMQTVPNFINWLCNLTNILKFENKEYALNTPVLEEPKIGATVDNVAKHIKHTLDELDVQCLLVRIVGPDL